MGRLDLVIYSLASPRRTHPATGETLNSVLKTLGKPFIGKTVDIARGTVGEVTIEPASKPEVTATIAVMGGEDWRMWIDALRDEDLLAEGARTLAYFLRRLPADLAYLPRGYDRRGEERPRANGAPARHRPRVEARRRGLGVG